MYILSDFKFNFFFLYFDKGAVAAALTTPLDVVKTLLNTQQHKVKGMLAGINTVYRVSGIWGFWKGLYPRVVYQVPSTAICWSVYELFKYILTRQKFEVKCSNKSITPTVLVSDRQISSKLRPVLLLSEVNLEPIKPLEQNQEMENVLSGSCTLTNFDPGCWSNAIPESLENDSVGKCKCNEKTLPQENHERTTIFEKSEWRPSIISGTEVFE